MTCLKCGQQNSDLAHYCQSCGNAVALQLAGPAIPIVEYSESEVYAGFLERFGAIIIDFIVLGVATVILSAMTFGGGVVMFFFGPWIYEAWLMSSEWQATVGKKALGLKVTGEDGKPISFSRATGRHFAKYISCLLLGFGYVMVAFTQKKQALHDMLAATLVVKSE